MSGKTVTLFRCCSAIGVFAAQSAIGQFHLLVLHVVAKTPALEPQPILTFPGFNALKLLDGIQVGSVVRVGLENPDCFGESVRQI